MTETKAPYDELARRLEAVASLMRCNDTCCFDTDSYRTAYCSRYCGTVNCQAKLFGVGWPRKHLGQIPGVAEVRRGIWTLTEDGADA